MKKLFILLAFLITLLCTNVYASVEISYPEEHIDEEGYIHFEGEKYTYQKNDKGQYEYVDDNGKTRIREEGIFADIDGFTHFKYKVVNGEAVVMSAMVANYKNEYTGKQPNNSVTEVTIPDKVDGYPIVKLSGCYFDDNVKKVTISDNIRVIGDRCFEIFAEQKGVEEFILPKNLESIGEGAFAKCGIKEINIPNGVTSMGANVFEFCKNLKKAHLPENLSVMGSEIFLDCTALETVNIPTGIMNSISPKTFSQCTALKNVTYSGEMTSALADALKRTPYFENNEDDSGDGMIIIGDTLTLYNGNENHVKIPEGIKHIGEKCFYGKDIESVEFPSTLEAIAVQAFAGTKLTKVTFPPSVKQISSWAFSGIMTLRSVEFEEGNHLVTLGLGAFENCHFLSEVTLPKRVNVGRQAFDDTLYGGYTLTDEEKAKLRAEEEANATPAPTKTPQPSAAEEADGTFEVEKADGELRVSVGGRRVEFTDAEPFIDENDRTQMPVRAVAEALGCDVDYKDGTVVICKGDKRISLNIGKQGMLCDGKLIIMDTEARLIGDRTYVPARYIAEALGMTVVWK